MTEIEQMEIEVLRLKNKEKTNFLRILATLFIGCAVYGVAMSIMYNKLHDDSVWHMYIEHSNPVEEVVQSGNEIQN